MVSCVALSEAVMCGRATLAIVVSSVYITIAAIEPTSISGRLRETSGGCSALLADMDGDVGTEAGDQRSLRLAVDGNADRHALDHLDPIAGGVLRRENREFRTRAGSDGFVVSLQLQSGIGVYLDLGRLAGTHVVQVGFLEVRVHPGAAVAHDRDHRHAGKDHLADLQARDLRDHAIGGGGGPTVRPLAGGARGGGVPGGG